VGDRPIAKFKEAGASRCNLQWAGRWPDAKKMLEPNSSGYVALGLKLARLGKWEEAVAAYREALRIDPANFEALSNLGFVFYEMGLDSEAKQALAQAEALRASSEKCDPNRP
jgi:Flp pilus assembly protein TadD